MKLCPRHGTKLSPRGCRRCGIEARQAANKAALTDAERAELEELTPARLTPVAAERLIEQWGRM